MPLQYLTREELYERIWEAPMSGTYGKRKTRHLQAWADWALGEADLLDPVKQGGLIAPAQVRKAMREKLCRGPTDGTGAASSEPGAEKTSIGMDFAGCRTKG